MSDPLIGELVAGRYRVRALIDRGGMGRVYRAEQEPLGRAVALKVLDLHDPDGEFQERFTREAIVQGRLTHPNTVRVFDSGRTGSGLNFLVMELLVGRSLKDVLAAEAPLDPLRVARIGRQICNALQEAHEQGLVHRDLKPANVFLTPHGDDPDFVKVLDFGLAKELAGDPGLSHTGQALGSPLYMAPEQVEGSPVDARTDVYALGLLLYAALAGELPFKRGSVATVMLQQVSARAPTFGELGRDLRVPPDLERVVRACLEKDMARRPGSMREVSRALELVERDLRDASTATRLAPLRPAPSSRLPAAIAVLVSGGSLAAGGAVATVGLALGALALWSRTSIAPVGAPDPGPELEAPVPVGVARVQDLARCRRLVFVAPVRGLVRAVVHPDDGPAAVTLRGPEHRQSATVLTELPDGVVTLELLDGEPGLPLEVEVRCPELVALDAGRATVRVGRVEGSALELVSESGDIELGGARLEALTVRVRESADVSLGAVELGRLDVELGGSGDLRASGRADALVVVQRGSGDASLAGLQVRSAEVTTMGSGDAELFVTERLVARSERSGDIHYAGAPQDVDARAVGSGRIGPR